MWAKPASRVRIPPAPPVPTTGSARFSKEFTPTSGPIQAQLSQFSGHARPSARRRDSLPLLHLDVIARPIDPARVFPIEDLGRVAELLGCPRGLRPHINNIVS